MVGQAAVGGGGAPHDGDESELSDVRAELAAALAREEEAKDVAEMVLTLAAAKEAESRQALASMALAGGMVPGGMAPGGMAPGMTPPVMMTTGGNAPRIGRGGGAIHAEAFGSAARQESPYRRHRPPPQRVQNRSEGRAPACFTASPHREEVSVFRSNLTDTGNSGFDTELLPGESAWMEVGEWSCGAGSGQTSMASGGGGSNAGPSPLMRAHRSPPSRPGSRGGSSAGLRKSQSSQGLLVEAAARERNNRFNQSAMSHSASQGSMGDSGSCFYSATRSCASSNASTRSPKTRPNNSATLELEALNKQRVRLGLFAIDPPIWSTPEEVRKHVVKVFKPHAKLPNGKSLYHSSRSVRCSYGGGSVPSWNWSTRVAGGPEPPKGLGELGGLG